MVKKFPKVYYIVYDFRGTRVFDNATVNGTGTFEGELQNDDGTPVRPSGFRKMYLSKNQLGNDGTEFIPSYILVKFFTELR